MFTLPTGTLPTKGRRLKGALEDMIFNARENITLVSYSMSTFSEEWFLWEEIAEKLSEGGIQLRVFGDKDQVAKIVNDTENLVLKDGLGCRRTMRIVFFISRH